MPLRQDLKESFDRFGSRTGVLLQEGLLDFYDQTRQRLREACRRGGECDPLADDAKRDEAHGAFMEAAEFFFASGYTAAADSLLVEWWNELGSRQRKEKRRAYRAKIAFKLTELHLRRSDTAAAFWWALHTQADDMLGEHPEGGGSGKIQLRTILGMSEEALRSFNEIAAQNVSAITRRTSAWSQPQRTSRHGEGVPTGNRRIAMSAISLRLPNSLHDSARQLAKKENISINQLITLALAEKVSALMAEEYLGKRAKRASKRKFQKAMAKVANVKPEAYDML